MAQLDPGSRTRSRVDPDWIAVPAQIDPGLETWAKIGPGLRGVQIDPGWRVVRVDLGKRWVQVDPGYLPALVELGPQLVDAIKRYPARTADAAAYLTCPDKVRTIFDHAVAFGDRPRARAATGKTPRNGR